MPPIPQDGLGGGSGSRKSSSKDITPATPARKNPATCASARVPFADHGFERR